MYTAVLMTALATTSASPTWHRGCYSCSCHGGCTYSYNYGCNGCACYGGHPHMYNPGCYGAASGAYGYHGVYGGYDPRYLGSTGCYGCYGGYSCYGIPVPVATFTSRPETKQPAFDPYLPINPPAKKAASPDKDGAEEVGAPKEKDKKAPGPDQKKTSLDSSTPIRAKVRIHVPEDGKLFVDDQPIKGPTGMRTFQTPPLAPGERYFYDIRIESAGEVRSRRVIIEPGQDVAVSFPGMTPTARAQR